MDSTGPKYLCIDDERGDRLEPILDRLRRHGLAVVACAPAPFDEEVTLIAQSNADGLLLDLRLDDVPNIDGVRVRYRAVALAQELRTRMTEGDIKPLPIVLWSVESKFQRSFSTDRTAHDLFDLVVSKTRVPTEAEPMVRKLTALAAGYPWIHELLEEKSSTFWQQVLGLGEHEGSLLDSRVGVELMQGAPTHDYARYIVADLLETSGPLVDEPLVAARLGVDLASEGWAKVRAWLDPTAYRGAFASGWQRWWWYQVETMLRGAFTEPFRNLPAEERVAGLQKLLRTRKLVAPPVPSGATGTRYWYVCAAAATPVDPVDAVLVESSERKVWQDRVYVSKHAVVNRRLAAKGLRIHPLEQPRVDGWSH